MNDAPNQDGESTNRPAENAPNDDAAKTDETAVRELYQRLMDGWNRGSGDAFASVFTEDGDLVGFDGTHLRGRAQIASFHQELFDEWLKGTRLIGVVENVTFPAPDVAVVHAVGRTIPSSRSTPAPERDSIQTLVATKRGDDWRFTAFQNTRIRPIGQGLAAVLAWKIADVPWTSSRLHKDPTPDMSVSTPSK